MSLEPVVKSGGVHVYRVTAECSACGRVVDVGPFTELSEAWEPGTLGMWLTPANARQTFRLTDHMGTPVTLCDVCVDGPLRRALALILTRKDDDGK